MRRHLPLLAVLAVALGVRLAWALLVESGTRQAFLLDASFYDRLARDLCRGKGFLWHTGGEPTAYHPPGYPFLLAAAYAVFGDSLLTAKLLNVVLGTLSCALVWALGTRAYGSSVGLVAAALLACMPGDVFYVSTTLSEVTFTFMLTAVVVLFVRWSQEATRTARLPWIALGALLGIAMLVRGVAVLFPGVFVAGWLLAGVGWRPVLLRTALAVLGLAVALTPWTVRNALVMGSPIFVSTGAGYVLFNAHSPGTEGGQNLAGNQLREKLFPWASALPRPQKEVMLSSAQLRYALRYMLTHPLRELRLVPRRLYRLYEDDHWAFLALGRVTRDANPRQRRRRVMDPVWEARWKRLADASFATLAVLAWIGLALALPVSRASCFAVPLAFAYFHLLHGLLLPANTRYHAPMLPFMAVLAAVTVRRCADPVRRWARRGLTTRRSRASPPSAAASLPSSSTCRASA